MIRYNYIFICNINLFCIVFKKNFAKCFVIQNKAVSLHRNQKTKGYKQNKSLTRRRSRHKKRSYEKSKHSYNCCYCSVKP